MNRLLLCVAALLALSLPVPTLAQDSGPAEAAPTEAVPTKAAVTEAVPTEAVPTKAAVTEAAPTEAVPTNAAPTEAGPKPIRHFTLGVATQEYFVALGAQLVSVGALVGAAALIAAMVDADAPHASPRPSGLVWAVTGLAAPLLAPIASACLLTLFEDRPGFKLRAGLRTWGVGVLASWFFAALVGGTTLYVTYQQNDRMRGPISVTAGLVAMVVLPPVFEVIAFEGGRGTYEPQRLSLLPFLTKSGGGLGLAGAF